MTGQYGRRPMRLTFEPPADPAAYPYAHAIRVRFAETDAMRIVHHAAYLPYLEEARVAYLRHLGHPCLEVHEEHGVDFAVLEAYVRYVQPLRFDDVVDVHLVLGAATRATFQMGYLLQVAGQTRASAVTVHGCVDRDGRPVRMPAWLGDLAPR
jgi:acyl-CoA thioester hydrolase